jgi:hypothetical protein
MDGSPLPDEADATLGSTVVVAQKRKWNLALRFVEVLLEIVMRIFLNLFSVAICLTVRLAVCLW